MELLSALIDQETAIGETADPARVTQARLQPIPPWLSTPRTTFVAGSNPHDEANFAEDDLLQDFSASPTAELPESLIPLAQPEHMPADSVESAHRPVSAPVIQKTPMLVPSIATQAIQACPPEDLPQFVPAMQPAGPTSDLQGTSITDTVNGQNITFDAPNSQQTSSVSAAVRNFRFRSHSDPPTIAHLDPPADTIANLVPLSDPPTGLQAAAMQSAPDNVQVTLKPLSQSLHVDLHSSVVRKMQFNDENTNPLPPSTQTHSLPPLATSKTTPRIDFLTDQVSSSLFNSTVREPRSPVFAESPFSEPSASVQIRIGRLEIRASLPSSGPVREPRHGLPPAAGGNVSDYLKRRARGNNR